MMLFEKHLNFIAAVTKALNTIPLNDDFYVHVELREEGTHRRVGAWSDEIGDSDWYFEADSDRDLIGNPKEKKA